MAAPPSPPQVLAVTTPSVEGYRIARYLGIVAGEGIAGAGIEDSTRNRVAAWEDELQRARFAAIAGMSQRAGARGANAVVGVSLDHAVAGHPGSMVLVTATGTAVVVEPIPR